MSKNLVSKTQKKNYKSLENTLFKKKDLKAFFLQKNIICSNQSSKIEKFVNY